MKKLLPILAVLILCLSNTNVNAQTYGNLTYEISKGEVAITGGDLQAKTIDIPAKIDGHPVTKIAKSAFLGSAATSVNIPDSIKIIENNAFYNCTSLTKVNISNLSAWVSIRFDSAYSNPIFYAKKLYLNNELITNLVIPDSVTTINKYAFRHCDSIKSLTIPGSVKSIKDSAFRACSSLKEINFHDGITHIGNHSFFGCASLTELTIPDSVTEIGSSAFRGCSSLKEITLPFIGSKRGNSDSPDSVFGYIFGYLSSTDKSGGGFIQHYDDSSMGYYYIPSSLKKVTITDETVIAYGSFRGCEIPYIIIKGSPSVIMKKAFVSDKPVNVIITNKDIEFSNSELFADSELVTLCSYPDFSTETYAKAHGIDFVPLKEGDGYTLSGTVTPQNNTLAVHIDSSNRTIIDERLLVALYNDEDTLINCNIVSNDAIFNSTDVEFENITGASYIKIFLLDDLVQFKPLTAVKILDIYRTP